MDAVLRELEESLVEAESEAKTIPEHVQRLWARQKELQQIATALRFAIEHRRTKLGVAAPSDGNWDRLSRPVVVERVLREASEPLSPSDIAESLRGFGRNDPAGGISATLTRLKADGKVESVGYGKWVVLADPPFDTLPTDSSDESDSNSEEPPDEEVA